MNRLTSVSAMAICCWCMTSVVHQSQALALTRPTSSTSSHREESSISTTISTRPISIIETKMTTSSSCNNNNRRNLLTTVVWGAWLTQSFASAAAADEEPEVVMNLSGETKQIFKEANALESQGKVPAAQRLYSKVIKLEPRYIYGYSSLGNTQVVLGELEGAEASYTTAINLCRVSRKGGDLGAKRECPDIYNLLLNRGCVRMNNGMVKEALVDLESAAEYRGRPDAVILQNRARARELNGYYELAERDYATAISMTANEVAPFWLRSSMVLQQLGDRKGALDLLRRVEVRFPDAPEVRAALSAMLFDKGDLVGAKRKLMEIPDEQRLKYTDETYLANQLVWPPVMIDLVMQVYKASL